jgi:hypothetical protein
MLSTQAGKPSFYFNLIQNEASTTLIARSTVSRRSSSNCPSVGRDRLAWMGMCIA